MKQRFHLIKRAISRDASFDELEHIDLAFNDETFRNLVQMIEIVIKLPEASIDQVLLETMKEDKPALEVAVIQTYSFLFI